MLILPDWLVTSARVEPRRGWGVRVVGGQVDADLALNVENHARGVDYRLLTGQGGQPVRHRIGTDRGGKNTGLGWNFVCHGKDQRTKKTGRERG